MANKSMIDKHSKRSEVNGLKVKYKNFIFVIHTKTFIFRMNTSVCLPVLLVSRGSK